jgi:hypothetical protein
MGDIPVDNFFDDTLLDVLINDLFALDTHQFRKSLGFQELVIKPAELAWIEAGRNELLALEG